MIHSDCMGRVLSVGDLVSDITGDESFIVGFFVFEGALCCQLSNGFKTVSSVVSLEKAQHVEPEPCLFPQPQLFVVGSWVTGDHCPLVEMRPEFHVEAACDGVRGLDAVDALPIGGHVNRPVGRYLVQTGCTYRD